MLAARDQENLVHGHLQAAASKPLNHGSKGLQPKTPGNKFPKTPLKVPLNDENAPTALGGKSGKGKGGEDLILGGKKNATFDKSAFVTPMGPRTRAPLGAKTTNAKAKGLQTPAGQPVEKDFDRSLAKQTSARKPKKVTHAETKIAVHGDESPLIERDVEYCPPRPKDLPYDSDVFPNNCLKYDAFKPGNRADGLYSVYLNPIDENGQTRFEREYEATHAKSVKEVDEQILKMLEEEWTVGDVPETFRHLKKRPALSNQKANVPNETTKPSITSSKGPTTIAARKAASALSVAPKPTIGPKLRPIAAKTTTSFLSRAKPAPPTLSTSSVINPSIRQASAAATSRSTIGYTKGRYASSALHHPQLPKTQRSGLQRAASNVSNASSDVTITPARYAKKEMGPADGWRQRLSFLDAFDADEEELEPGLRGLRLSAETIRLAEDDEEFIMPVIE